MTMCVGQHLPQGQLQRLPLVRADFVGCTTLLKAAMYARPFVEGGGYQPQVRAQVILPGSRWRFLPQQAHDAAALGAAFTDECRHVVRLCAEALWIAGYQLPCRLHLERYASQRVRKDVAQNTREQRKGEPR